MIERIGRFRVLDVSGTGTFATVYRAEDERLDDVVALKVLAENHSLDGEIRERFIREGRALRRIASPHVAAVHDLGETERQQPYLVLQYADRGTLADRVARRRRGGWTPDAADVRTVANSLTEAIDATHRARIVHRDLSPRNILLRSTSPDDAMAADAEPLVADTEELLLADLGLCKDLALHSGLTVAGGTAGFRPPEQRGEGGLVSPAADLWSLSAVIAWLLTGQTPDDDVDVTAADVTAAAVAAGLPAALGSVLVRGLAADPRARPSDAWAWYREVDDALMPTARLAPDAEPTPASPTRAAGAARDAPAGQAAAGRPRRLRPWMGGVAILAVVAVVLGALQLRGEPVAVTDLGDGNVLVERHTEGAQLALAGPQEVLVGERATFEARASGITTWTWIAPDGVALVDRATLTFATSSVGFAVVQLLGVTEDGEVLHVEHRLDVRPAPD
jgi:eukaryotic-like serine/threonine-protein kinase